MLNFTDQLGYRSQPLLAEWCRAGFSGAATAAEQVRRRLCLVVPLPSWPRHCLCLVVPTAFVDKTVPFLAAEQAGSADQLAITFDRGPVVLIRLEHGVLGDCAPWRSIEPDVVALRMVKRMVSAGKCVAPPKAVKLTRKGSERQ